MSIINGCGVRFIFILSIFCLQGCGCFAQQADSSWFKKIDSLFTDSIQSKSHNRKAVTHAAADSTVVQGRQFNEATIRELKNDPDLNYQEPPMVAESLWDRLLLWFKQFLEDFFQAATTTQLGKLIMYIIGLFLFIVIVMMLLKVNAFKIFYSGEGHNAQYQVLDENIHEMDFEKLIHEAIDQKDYRRGIRLLFLYALKLASDKQLIHWKLGKTNREYVTELDRNDLKTRLNELSFYFDYAWYGNFNITLETFKKAQDVFSDWKKLM